MVKKGCFTVSIPFIVSYLFCLSKFTLLFRSDKAGKLLAEVLLGGLQGNRYLSCLEVSLKSSAP